MQHFLSCLFLGFLVIPPIAADEAWWSAATAAYARGLAYEPGHTMVRIEELEADGQVKALESGEIRTHRIDGILVSTVIRAEKNGKDVTADWQKRYNRSSEEGRGGPPAGFDATPFDPGWTSALSLGTPRRASEGMLIPYTIRRDGVELEGSAVFGTDGKALSASQNWLQLPPFVSAMSSTIQYRVLDLALLGDGVPVAAGARTSFSVGYGILVAGTMQIEGQASILFVKKRFRMSFQFDQWRPKPAGN